MLVSILSGLFFIFNLFLIILVVMQKNYGGFWSGPAGNDSVVIFGGNQGADVLQKITWFFGILLMVGSLFLSIYKASSSQVSTFYIVNKESDKNLEKKIEKIEKNIEQTVFENQNNTNDDKEKKEEKLAIENISEIKNKKDESEKINI